MREVRRSKRLPERTLRKEVKRCISTYAKNVEHIWIRENTAIARRKNMRKRTFYKLNAAAWIFLIMTAADPVSDRFRDGTPLQFVAIMCVFAFVVFLACTSLMLMEKEK